MTDRQQELTLTTIGGRFKVDTRTLLPGLRRSLMAGRAAASQVPLFQVLTQEQTYDDFPALVQRREGCRIGWIEFKDGAQRILSRRLADGAWSPHWRSERGRTSPVCSW